MKTILTLLLGFIFFIPMRACAEDSEPFRLIHDESDISNVYIVDLTFNSEMEMVQTVRKEVTDIEGILADLQKVEGYRTNNDPTPVTPTGMDACVIKILYSNNDYELINYSGQAKYTHGYGLRHYAGYSYYDQSQFEALIEKYLNAPLLNNN